MAINRVEYNGRVLIDLNEDTVTEDNLLEGIVAHDASGNQIVGTIRENGDVSQSFSGLVETSIIIPKGYTTGGTINLTDEIEQALAKI